jgi:SPP1 family predicted phage head-tail adaptor
MSVFYINSGDLRTQIRIQKQTTSGTGSFATKKWVDLGNTSDTDPPRYVYAKWESVKGLELWAADSVQAADTNIVTIRYNPAVNAACQIICGGITYQIKDVSDPTQRKQWLQIRVMGAVMG